MGRRRAESDAGRSKPPVKVPRTATRIDASVPAGRHFRAHRSVALWLKIVATATAVALLAGAGVVAVLVLRLQGNVTVSDLNAGVGAAAAASKANDSTDPLQILILGTDTRDGANSEYGNANDSTGNGQSDVMLLMNISADNKRVTVTSFPRDLMMPIPSCRDPKTGEATQAMSMGQLNGALSVAGPGCTVAAINEATGLNIDHFMLADFTAVKELSNALGGVEVCVDHAMDDFDGSHLVLPAGKSLVQGEQALAFLRTRHSFGTSSDLDRIQAQQYFLGSMVRKIKSDDTLNNLPKVYGIADTITKNLTIDSGLANIPSMVALADRLKKVDLAGVAFITVPYEAFVGDTNRVQLKEPEAAQLFAGLRDDANFTGTAPASASPTAPPSAAPSSAAPSVPATTAPVPPAAPAYNTAIQPVTVVNGSGLAGRATEILAVLQGAGYTNSFEGRPVATASTTTIAYGADFADVAADVAALYGIPATALAADPTINGVQLRLGADFISGTKYGTNVLPPDIVASTADDAEKCLVVNPGYYTY
ncbi:LCP family protein [Pseudarthrobacter sp. P1]|uniref:LCP family protein n=1 Tax=Pseudarthrobacter sp. P1 TaxID=3418418 RepID=UPI003CEC8A82